MWNIVDYKGFFGTVAAKSLILCGTLSSSPKPRANHTPPPTNHYHGGSVRGGRGAGAARGGMVE